MVRLWSVAGFSLAMSHFTCSGVPLSLPPPGLRTGILVKQTSTLADPKHTRVGYARDGHFD